MEIIYNLERYKESRKIGIFGYVSMISNISTNSRQLRGSQLELGEMIQKSHGWMFLSEDIGNMINR